MKKIKKIKEKVFLHPIMTFLILIGVTILLSGLFELFALHGDYSKVNANSNSLETKTIIIKSIFSLSGIKYIFSNTVSNFSAFAPLVNLIIVLLGIGIMDKSGYLESLFYLLTHKLRKNVVTFILAFIGIILSIVGDISFVVLIPIAALLFKYGKRNPQAGIITAFASIACGTGVNIFLNSTDSNLINYTNTAANIIDKGFTFSYFGLLFIMIIATVILSFIITNVTEKIIIPKLGKYEFDYEEKVSLTKKEKKGLLISGFFGTIYLLIFIYNIIPGLPLSGNLLDYSQARYIDKLFGYNSFFNSGFIFIVTTLFFILGLSYGIGAKTIGNHKDVCEDISHSLDNLGQTLVLIFFASTFISILKYTEIGNVITAMLSSLISNSGFTGIPLILLVFFVVIICTIISPQSINKWAILSGIVVPTMMNAGMSAEFAQLVFRAGECVSYGLTPVLAYFVIYLTFMQQYNQDPKGISIWETIKYIMPYALFTMVMWICLLILAYLIGLPTGIGASAIL